MNSQNIKKEIFWKEHELAEKQYLTEANSNLKLRTIISFITSLVCRLWFAYFLAPAMLIFNIFVFESFQSGIAETINAVFSSRIGPLTDQDVRLLLVTWHASAVGFFAISWLHVWRSPISQYVENRMYDWWLTNKDSELISPCETAKAAN